MPVEQICGQTPGRPRPTQSGGRRPRGPHVHPVNRQSTGHALWTAPCCESGPPFAPAFTDRSPIDASSTRPTCNDARCTHTCGHRLWIARSVRSTVCLISPASWSLPRSWTTSTPPLNSSPPAAVRRSRWRDSGSSPGARSRTGNATSTPCTASWPKSWGSRSPSADLSRTDRGRLAHPARARDADLVRCHRSGHAGTARRP